MRPLDAALDAIAKHETPNAELIAAKCRGLMRGYSARWQNSEMEVTGVEEMLTSDLWNPATEAKSRSFTLAGKLDVRAKTESRMVLIDHKTCSEDITDPNSTYWRQVMVEGQPRHYELLEWLNGRRTEYAIWDVVRKPMISPKKLTNVDARTAMNSRRYFEHHLSDADVESVAADGRETLGMYEARLANDCTVERPEWYFARRPVALIEAEVLEHAEELWGLGQEILQARRANRWPRNSGACMLYGSPCKFLGICSGYDTPESENWTKKQWVHPELPVLNGDAGKGVLTNSRCKSFLTCRRKHFYEYELGIERVDSEEREALVFGQLWHVAQEAWWNTQMTKGSDNGDTSFPATEVGPTAEVNAR